MNSRRTIILIVAVVVGAVAAFGVTAYIRNIEDSVYAGTELQTVWVVQQPIPKGTSAERAIQEQLIAQSELPVDFRPATAITDPALELAGLVAITDLPANATLVQGNFVAPSVVATGITDRLEEKGMVTVTFNIDQVGGAAYLIEPGDFINIMGKYAIEEPEEDEATGDNAEGEAPAPSDDGETRVGQDRSDVDLYTIDARYIYQRAEVLVVGASLPADLGDTQAEGEEAAAAAAGNQGLITLAVPPEVAQELVSIGIDRLYLSLVPSTYEPYAIPPIDVDQRVLAGEDDTRLTPYLELAEEPVE